MAEPLIPINPTPEQLANRMNPTPVQIQLPTGGSGLFRSVGDFGSTLYQYLPNGGYRQIDLLSIGRDAMTAADPRQDQYGSYLALQGQNAGSMAGRALQIIKEKYGIDYNSLPQVNMGDYIQSLTKIPGATRDNPGGGYGPTSEYAQVSKNILDFVNMPNVNLAPSMINNTGPNTLGSADQWRAPDGSLHLYPTGQKLPAGYTLVAQNINAANLQGKSIETPPNAQQTTATQTAAPTQTGATATSQSQPNDITQLLSLPNLAPGSQGQEVLTLQNWLVAHGFLTASDLATGPGIYGPKTTAAVAAWQAANGINPQGNPGYFGPISKAFLQQQVQSGAQTPQPGTVPGQTPTGTQTQTTTGTQTQTGTQTTTGTQTQQGPITPGGGAPAAPQISDLTVLSNQIRKLYGLPEAGSGTTLVQQAISDYQNVYTALGIPTVKGAYEQAQKDFDAVQTELNDKIADINEDPWLSEGIRVSRVNKLKERYEGKLAIATGKMNFYKSLVDQGTAQAKDILGQIHNAQTDINMAVNQAIDIVTKQIDAASAMQRAQLSESNKTVQLSPGETIFNPSTGKSYTAPNKPTTPQDRDTQVVEIAGRKVLIDTQTGQTIQDLGLANAPGSSGPPKGSIVSGNLTYTPADQSADEVALNKSRGTDGWVDPNVYLSLYNAWLKKGGSVSDFLKQYPPKLYVNPLNDWLPPILRNTNKALVDEIDSLTF